MFCGFEVLDPVGEKGASVSELLLEGPSDAVDESVQVEDRLGSVAEPDQARVGRNPASSASNLEGMEPDGPEQPYVAAVHVHYGVAFRLVILGGRLQRVVTEAVGRFGYAARIVCGPPYAVFMQGGGTRYVPA